MLVDWSFTFDRFEEVQEDDIEDSILNPTEPQTGVSTLADQQEILELWCSLIVNLNLFHYCCF